MHGLLLQLFGHLILHIHLISVAFDSQCIIKTVKNTAYSEWVRQVHISEIDRSAALLSSGCEGGIMVLDLVKMLLKTREHFICLGKGVAVQGPAGRINFLGCSFKIKTSLKFLNGRKKLIWPSDSISLSLTL